MELEISGETAIAWMKVIFFYAGVTCGHLRRQLFNLFNRSCEVALQRTCVHQHISLPSSPLPTLTLRTSMSKTPSLFDEECLIWYADYTTNAVATSLSTNKRFFEQR